MSILKVDTINEKTTGNGVAIQGHGVTVAQYTTASTVINSKTSVVQAMITVTFTLKNSSNKVLVTMNCITRSARRSDAGVRIAMYSSAVAAAASVKLTSGVEAKITTTTSGTEQKQITK